MRKFVWFLITGYLSVSCWGNMFSGVTEPDFGHIGAAVFFTIIFINCVSSFFRVSSSRRARQTYASTRTPDRWIEGTTYTNNDREYEDVTSNSGYHASSPNGRVIKSKYGNDVREITYTGNGWKDDEGNTWN